MALYPGNKRDVYLKIAEKYEQYIRLGILKDGDKLPSVRVAAGELGVNPNTVQKAYSYLEERGLIASLLKKGAYVTYKDETSKEAAEEKLRARKFLIELKEKGVTESEITDIIKEVYGND